MSINTHKINAATEVAVTQPPVAARRSALLYIYVCLSAGVFAWLTWLAYTQPHAPLDLYLTTAAQRVEWRWLAPLMRLISDVGRFPYFVAIILIITALLSFLRLRREAGVSIASVVATYMLSVWIKAAIDRPRPNSSLIETYVTNTSSSFPSGHVLTYVVYFGFLWFLTFILLKKGLLRQLLLAVFGALVLLVGPSRVYLGEHWTSDVVAAYFLGSLLLILTLSVYRRVTTRT